MTKEELEKEAKDSWWNDNNCSGALPTEKIYECGYLASAEPREKRIAELEKENAELTEKCYQYSKDVTRLILEKEEIVDSWDIEVESVKKELTKARICLEQLISEITVGELEVDPNILQQAEQFLNEVEK